MKLSAIIGLLAFGFAMLATGVVLKHYKEQHRQESFNQMRLEKFQRRYNEQR